MTQSSSTTVISPPQLSPSRFRRQGDAFGIIATGLTNSQLVPSIELDPMNSSLWIQLGQTESLWTSTETLMVLGKPWTQKECLVHALTLNPLVVTAWNALGCLVGPRGTVQLHGQKVRAVECFATALTFANDSATWNNLACSLQPDESVLVRGNKHSTRSCLLRSLECDSNNASAWLNLGLDLSRNESTTLEQDALQSRFGQLTPMDCFGRALSSSSSSSQQQQSSRAAAWAELGRCLKDDATCLVGPERVGKAQCFAYYLTLSTNHTQAMDQSHCEAWKELALALEHQRDAVVMVRGETIIYERALVHAQQEQSLEDHHHDRQLLIRTLEENPAAKDAWYDLGLLLGRRNQVMIRGISIRAADCFARVLQQSPNDSNAWNNLGTVLRRDEVFILKDTTNLSNTSVTRRDCFAKALELHPYSDGAWANMAATLTEHDSISPVVHIALSTFTRTECLANHYAVTAGLSLPLSITTSSEMTQETEVLISQIQQNPRHPSLWFDLGTILASYDSHGNQTTVCIGDRRVDAIDCWLEIIWLTPSDSEGWNNLGVCLGDEAILFEGERMGRGECFERAVRLAPHNEEATANLQQMMSELNGATDEEIRWETSEPRGPGSFDDSSSSFDDFLWRNSNDEETTKLLAVSPELSIVNGTSEARQRC